MASARSDRLRWSIYAGLYTFGCGTVTAMALADVLALLAEVIGLPATLAMAILASPALLVGAVVWWAVVERRGSYSYRVGGVFGSVTALVMGLLWTARFVSVWGVELLAIDIVALLVGVVLGVAIVAGGLAGVLMMYVRRRLGSEPAGTLDGAG